MNESIQVFSEPEKQLIRDGIIEGDIYKDGEIFADALSLMYWREHGEPLPKDG